jgi:hypothetical protein
LFYGRRLWEYGRKKIITKLAQRSFRLRKAAGQQLLNGRETVWGRPFFPPDGSINDNPIPHL